MRFHLVLIIMVSLTLTACFKTVKVNMYRSTATLHFTGNALVPELQNEIAVYIPKVIDALMLSCEMVLCGDKNDDSSLIEAIKRKIEIEISLENTNTFLLSYRTTDPELTVNILNLLSKELTNIDSDNITMVKIIMPATISYKAIEENL